MNQTPSYELQATLELSTSHDEVYRIHQPKQKVESDLEKKAIEKRVGIFRAIGRKVFGRTEIKSSLGEMLGSYQSFLEHNAQYKNPDDFFEAIEFAKSQGLEILTGKDFAAMLSPQDWSSDGFGHMMPVVTKTQNDIYFERHHIFPEAAIYHPSKKQIILVRNSPMLLSKESFQKGIAAQRIRYECIGVNGFVKEGCDTKLLDEGQFFLTENQYQLYVQQAREEAEKLPWERNVQILELGDKPRHIFDPRNVNKFNSLATINFKYHEATQFLFGDDNEYRQFSSCIEAKKSSPSVIIDIVNHPSNGANKADFLVINDGMCAYTRRHDEESSEKGSMAPFKFDKPFVMQTGFSAYSRDNQVVQINLCAPLPFGGEPVRAIKRK